MNNDTFHFLFSNRVYWKIGNDPIVFIDDRCVVRTRESEEQVLKTCRFDRFLNLSIFHVNYIYLYFILCYFMLCYVMVIFLITSSV